MKSILSLIVCCAILFVRCSQETQVETPKQEALKKRDTVVELKMNSPEAIQRFMDSLQKTGVSFSATAVAGTEPIEGGAVKTTISQDQKLELIDLEGVKSLIQSSKKKYTLLHFWATWCKPCRKEFSEFITFCNDLKDTDVILISTDLDSPEQRKKVISVYKTLDTNFPNFLARALSKSDLLNKSGQLDIIHYFDHDSNGGLPYNLLIENKSGKLKIGTSEFEKLRGLK